MNANEIIQEFVDYLKEIEELPWGNHQILCDQAAAMLCQLQSENEALKAENQFFKDIMGDVEILRKAQDK